MDKEHIDETRLVTRRSARDQVLLAWNYRCIPRQVVTVGQTALGDDFDELAE